MPKVGSMTAEELLAHGDEHELEEGELVSVAPVGMEHGEVAVNLCGELRAWNRRTRRGTVLVEVGFVLRRSPDTVLGPDIAFVLAERLAGRAREGFFEGPPDLAVEIVSPSETSARLRRKIQQYLAAGAREAWLVAPARREVTVHAAGAPERVLGAEEVLTSPALLPGFRLPLAELFVGE